MSHSLFAATERRATSLVPGLRLDKSNQIVIGHE